MPTLREYFFADANTLTAHSDVTFPIGNDVASAISRCHMDFNAAVRYASYFLHAGPMALPAARALIADPEFALRVADQQGDVSFGHATLSRPKIVAHQMPFSGRVFLYVDELLSAEQRNELYELGKQGGVVLEVRDTTYAEELTALETPLAFISHDSRDKEAIALPLANQLRSMLCPVWYDDFALKVGDSLRESIDEGLRECRKCLVILSPNFVSNPGWNRGEFNAIVTRHFSAGGGVLLPIWHEVGRAEVAAYSPLVADIVALRWSDGIENIATKLFNQLRS